MKLNRTTANLRNITLLTLLGVLPGHSAPIQYSAWASPVNLGTVVNSPANDFAPHISANGLSLIFASTRPGGSGGEDLWVSQRATISAPWGSPVNLGATINTDGNERSPALSPDGRSLYFATTRTGGFGGLDIWVSQRADPLDDFGWQAPVNLGPVINSASTDAGPSVFLNDVTGVSFLYLASNRAGSLDLYVSEMAADGSFGPLVPINELNTATNDLTPGIRRDGLEIFFASNRTGGGFALWTSTRDTVTDHWGAPVNLGPGINTGSETFPALLSNGRELFFNSNRPGSLGESDLYITARAPVPEPRALILCGAGLLLLAAKRWRKRLVSTLSVASLLMLNSKIADADAVTDWNTIMLATVSSQTPFVQGRVGTITHLAVFEAVNAITKDYQPYLGTITAVQGASPDAAAVAAAHRVLRNYIPGSAASLDAERTRSLTQIPDSPAKTYGIAAGEAAAAAMITLRANDGSGTPMQYTPLIGVGFWQPTPPAFGPATFLHWGKVTPFGLLSPDQFRSKPPPALTSGQYRRDYNEVKEVGGVNSTARPQDRADIARYAAMTSPVQIWNRVALQVSTAQRMSLSENARLFALLNMAISDASIAVFEAKYFYHYWRPVTAIRVGDTDGNPRTEPDPGFTPFINTPTYPSYPSSHGSQSNAGRYVLDRIFGGGRYSITLSNPALPGVTLQYTKFRQITDDIADARVYGGIHFRFEQDEAELLGRRVARYVQNHHLQCAHTDRCEDSEDDEEDK